MRDNRHSRHSSTHRPSDRRHWRTASLWGRSLWWRMRHQSPEETGCPLTGLILIEAERLTCRRCTRVWDGDMVKAVAEGVGVSIVRSGEAALEVCPWCGVYERLLSILSARLAQQQAQEGRTEGLRVWGCLREPAPPGE